MINVNLNLILHSKAWNHLPLDRNAWNHLTVSKQMSSCSFKNATDKLLVYKSYIFNIYV